jgi:hypothetical protein
MMELHGSNIAKLEKDIKTHEQVKNEVRKSLTPKVIAI